VHTGFGRGYLMERDHYEYLGLDGLKWVFSK